MMLRGLWRALFGKSRVAERDALLGAGVAAAGRGDYAAAGCALERATLLDPGHADAWNARGNVAKLQGDLEEAAVYYRRALALAPDAAGAWANLGLCLREDGLTAAALAALEHALALAPGDVEAALSHAAALSDAGRYDEAIAELQRVVSAHPDAAQAHALLAHIHLLNERYAEGWAEYAWRWRIPGAERLAPLPLPEWTGAAAPHARLLVRAEQALGDQLMLSSCVPDALACVREVWLECDSRLASLFARSFPAVRVLARSAGDKYAGDDGEPDVQIPLGSLPRLFRRSGEDFPAHAYLSADPARVARWRARLDALGAGKKVGISWRGGAIPTRRNLRSMPLAAWTPILANPAAVFVSLQYGPCDDELRALQSGASPTMVHHFPEAIADYEETAALVAALDLVISVQTAVVHLAGALGRPAWVMVSAAPEWRYLARGERMPWYNSVRLFRQERLREWDRLIARVADRLAQGID